MESSDQKRRFPPPWTLERRGEDSFVVKDRNGVKLATVYCRDDLQKWSHSHAHLSSDEARRIARAITRIPEFMMQRSGFYSREGGHPRWRAARPYHVALEDSYIRANWDFINAMCKLNGIPLNATGEKIQHGGLWCVYEFAEQMEAMMFWDQFNGRWLRGTEFTYPDRPKDMPTMKQLKDWKRFQVRDNGWC
jgi:hypothetical protein